jgi:hypothetical protein
MLKHSFQFSASTSQNGISPLTAGVAGCGDVFFLCRATNRELSFPFDELTCLLAMTAWMGLPTVWR